VQNAPQSLFLPRIFIRFSWHFSPCFSALVNMNSIAIALAITAGLGPTCAGIHLCNQLRSYEEDEAAGVRSFVHWLGKQPACECCVSLLAFGPLMEILMVDGGWKSLAPVVAVWTLQLTAVTATIVLAAQSGEEPWRRLFRVVQKTGPLALLAILPRYF
jgi:1,4-dihydroxy-2-naphthoate octaprenyltransferase